MSNTTQNNDWYIFTAKGALGPYPDCFLFSLLPGLEFGWEVPNTECLDGPSFQLRSNDQNDYFRVKDVRLSMEFFNGEVLAALRFDY